MDWVFIDTPGNMDSASAEAAKHADMVLIPTQAQIFAIDTLVPLKRLLDMAGNPPAFVVLNLVHPTAGGRPADEDAPALGQTQQELDRRGVPPRKSLACSPSFQSRQA